MPLQFQWLSYLLLLPGSGCPIIQQTLILQESWRGQTLQHSWGICCHSTPRIWLASVRFLTMWDFTSCGSTYCWCWTTGEGKSWNSPPTNKTVPFWAKRRIGNKETGIFPRANQSTSESFARKGAPNKLPLSEPKKAKSVCHSATWVTVKQSLVKYALDGKTRCEGGNLVSSQAG